MKKQLTLLLLALSTVTNAAYFNLADAPYNLTLADYSVKVSDRYATGKDTIALPYAWAAFKGKGWGLTYAQFRSLWYFSAAYTDAAWLGESTANTARGYLNEFNFVDIPNGRFQSNVSLTIPRGGVRGTGTFGYYLGSNAYTTEIVMDDAHWIDTDKKWHERVLMATPQWDDESFYSYNESYSVSLLHFSGPDKNDGIIRIGIAFGRSGEASKWDLLKSDYFSYGIVARQGVPMSGGVCSVFGNSIAGFAGIGCALASMDIDVISGDRNNALAMLIPGYGANGGGNLNIGLAKAEDANPQGGGKYGSQVIGWFEEQFHVTIANVRYSCDTRINDALFVVNPVTADHLDWGTQGSYLRATGQGFNYHSLLHNVSTSTRIEGGANYKSWSFEWFADGNRFVTNGPGDFAWKPAGTKALASLARDPNTGASIGSWNYAAGTPARTGSTTPTPNPCTWSTGPWSAWSACVNGQQSHTRTVTSTGDCTGVAKPSTVEYQACTVTPTPCTIAYTVTATCSDGTWSKRTAKITGGCVAPADSLSRACKVVPPVSITQSSSPQDLAYLVDGNVATKWTSGAPQKGGEYFIAKLDAPSSVSSITMEGGDRWYDCAVAYTVYASTNGTAWDSIAAGKGNPNSRDPLVVSFKPVNAQWVQVKQTGKSATNWWTVAEFSVQRGQPITTPEPTGQRNIKGINCANGEQFAVAKGFQTAVDALHVTLMRWPGGTVANTYHNADLSTMVSISKASKVDVLWVANVNDGTTAELLAALAAFKSEEVNVVGIELGNEGYLKKWQDAFPTVQDYITKCKTFIAALDASPYADIPVGIVAAPSADMKDPDSNGTGTDRLNSWNPAVLNAGIGDAMVVHAYASTATVANFLSYASDHFNYVSTISKKPVWVTEYNLLGAEQSAAQSAFIGDMLTMMRNDSSVQFACLHNLAASGQNNNAIAITGGSRKPVAALTKMGQAFAGE